MALLDLGRGGERLVEVAALDQAGDGVVVQRAALGLPVRLVRAADLGALVPVQAEPAQRVQQRVVGLGGVAGGVGVLDPEHERAADVAGVGPVEQRGADQADVRACRWGSGRSGPGRRARRTSRPGPSWAGLRTRFTRALPSRSRGRGCAARRCPRSRPRPPGRRGIGPTPAGVPVRMTSPGSSVKASLTVLTRVTTSWISCEVRPSWTRPAVQARADGQVVDGELVGGDQPRAERAEGVEALGAGPLQVALLQVAGGDVVGHGVAEHHLGHALRRDVLAQPADDDGELALVVDVGALPRQHDRVAGPTTEVLGLRNIAGSVGAAPPPISATWSA